MSLGRSLWQLAHLMRRGAAQKVNKAGLSAPWPTTFAPLSAGFHTSIRRNVEEESSSSESESDSDSETAAQSSPLVYSEVEEDERAAVLRACLHLVREGGWSREVLAKGTKEAGFEGKEGEMFPNGPGDLVNLFDQQCNERLYQYMEKLSGTDYEGSKVIRPSVEHRLRMLAPYIEKWPQAMALKAYPPVAVTALENLSLMVDDIWYIAGDRSTDLNWYSKRTILAAIYTSTELYMVQDESEDFQETWRFLDNRLQGVHDVSNGAEQMAGLAKGALDLVCAGLENIRGSVGELTERK